MLSAQALKKLDEAVAKYPPERRSSAVMAALALAQQELGWVSPEVIQWVAEFLHMPAIAVQEVATFYTMYETTPVGRYKITVCTNLPCALSGANEASAYLQKKLDIGFNQTTADGLFTLKEGECMGACGDAPVMLLNNTQMCSRMSREKVDQLLADLRAEALAHNSAQHIERGADALTSADAKKDASPTPTSLGAAS